MDSMKTLANCITGLEELDEYLKNEEIIEFYSTSQKALDLIYHRMIVMLSPLNLLIVKTYGGLNPAYLNIFKRILRKHEIDIGIRRAFKAEEIAESIKAFEEDKDLIIYNPYGFRKLYARLIGAIKARRARTIIFSLMDRKEQGSTFGLHIAHTVIEIKEYRRGLGFKFIKSPIVGEIEIKIPLNLILNSYKIELTNWFI
jgi:hypothetical protein